MIYFAGALVAIGPLSLDMYLPAMPAMAESFDVPIVSLNNTISIYLVGFGLSQFLGGAFSDQIGRKRVGLTGLAIFIVASLMFAFAKTIEQAQMLRFVQAFGGGFCTVICMAIVRDVYPLAELGKRMAMMSVIMLACPVVAPAIGAALLHLGWPAIFIFKAAYAGVMMLIYWQRVPETQPGEWHQLSLRQTVRQCAEVMSRRVNGARLPLMFAVAMSLSAASFMTFLTNSSFAYMTYFNVSSDAFPLYFSISLIGLIATNIYSMRTLTPEKAPKYFFTGLSIQTIAVITLVTVVTLGPMGIWSIVIPVMALVASFGLSGPSGSSMYMGMFEKLAGSASSLYTTLMFSMGAVFGAMSGLFFDGTLLPMSLTMLCATSCAMLLGLVIRSRQRKND